MGAKENPVMRRIWLAASAISRLFRVQSGIGWVPTRGEISHLDNGDILVPGGRPIALGLGMTSGDPVPGPGDILGWTSIEITPEMVGRTVAVFTSIETKPNEKAHKRESQYNFVKQVKDAGGIAGFASTPEMALALIQDFTPLRKTA